MIEEPIVVWQFDLEELRADIRGRLAEGYETIGIPVEKWISWRLPVLSNPYSEGAVIGILPDWMIRDKKIIDPFEPGVKRKGKISYGVSSYGYDCRVGYKFRMFSPIATTEIDPKNFDDKALVDVDLTPQMHDLVRIVQPHDYQFKCTKCRMYTSSDEERNCPAIAVPDFIRIPPHSFALAESVETFNIPRDVLAVVIGKSTYARCGLIVNVTPLEPEWKGKVTIELSNTTPLPMRVYANEGIMQVLFFRSEGCTSKELGALHRLILNLTDKGWFQDEEDDWQKHVASGTCVFSYADKGGKYQDLEGLTLPKVDDTDAPKPV